jgi:hypothetical protein
MLRPLGLLCAALAMFSIAGGHWAVVQTVAWGQMLRDYSQRTGSVLTAVEQTFDGQHPCDLCRGIASAKAQAGDAPQKQSPSQQETVKSEKKDKPFPLDDHAPLARLVGHELKWLSMPFVVAPSRVEQPPTPPPRFALA